MNGLVWSAEHETDGHIPSAALGYLHPIGPRPQEAAELVAAGLWLKVADGWQVALEWDKECGQTSHETLERRREGNRKRQSAWYEKRQADSSDEDGHNFPT